MSISYPQENITFNQFNSAQGSPSETPSDLAQRIAERCGQAKLHGDNWHCLCPAHDDSNPSLSITATRDKVLIKCHAGCTAEAIMAALDMTVKDLYPTNTKPKNNQRRIVKVYDYVDAAGNLLHQTVRYEPKKFLQRRPDPAKPGEYLWNLNGITPVLFRLPDVLQALQRGDTIYLAEGEKDVDTLCALGLVATCNPMGAKYWKADYSETLRGAHVVILPDNDKAGEECVRKLTSSLAGIAASLKVVRLPGVPPKGDVTDWVRAGGTREQLAALVATEPNEPVVPVEQEGQDSDLQDVIDEEEFFAPGEEETLAEQLADDALAGGVTQQPAVEDIPYSDVFNAAHLVKLHGQDLRYCKPFGGWIAWNGMHWDRDGEGEAMRRARATIFALINQARRWLDRVSAKIEKATLDGTYADRKVKDALSEEQQAVNTFFAHGARSLQDRRLLAMLHQAESMEGIEATADLFDTDPWLLNAANGTLDLRTSTLRPPQRDDYITLATDVIYDPKAHCPLWERFLWRAMGGAVTPADPDTMSASEAEERAVRDAHVQEMVEYLQQIAGYSLTGSAREQCFFLLYGITKTGKSTFVGTLRRLHGPYGAEVEMQSFMEKDRPEVRNDLADLAGKRYVCATEGKKGRRLSEDLVKKVTGGLDHMKVRFLFKEYFDFRPQFKLFLGTNEKPVIKDENIWERVKLIDFAVQIPKAERDLDLDDKLQKELSGILTWAVHGCRAWQDLGGLKEPATVTESTAAYQVEMDTIQRFLDECCLLGTNFQEKMGALHAAYKHWCESNNERWETMTDMGQRLDKQGFAKHESHGIWRLGLRLREGL